MKPEQFYGLTKELLERQKAAFERSITHLATAVVELRDKCDELERRAMTPGPKGEDGRNGIDGRDGANGRDGVDGKDVSDERVFKALESYLKSSPIRDGVDGKDGRDGIDGKDGRDGIDGKDAEPIDIRDVVRELIAAPEIKTIAELAASEAVGEYFKANPIQHGKDGAPGRDGKDGRDGNDGDMGPRGEKGDPGEDGRGLTGFLVNRDGELVATTNKGEVLSLGRIVGKDGADGKDGVSYEGHSVTYDPVTHEGVIRTLSGIETRFPLPGIVGKGYWREGTRAKANEAWTHDGTLWIAKCETDSKPGIGNDDWYIGARKGRDATK